MSDSIGANRFATQLSRLATRQLTPPRIVVSTMANTPLGLLLSILGKLPASQTAQRRLQSLDGLLVRLIVAVLARPWIVHKQLGAVAQGTCWSAGRCCTRAQTMHLASRRPGRMRLRWGTGG